MAEVKGSCHKGAIVVNLVRVELQTAAGGVHGEAVLHQLLDRVPDEAVTPNHGVRLVPWFRPFAHDQSIGKGDAWGDEREEREEGRKEKERRE